MLACYPEDLRNPGEALTLAVKANQLSGASNPFVLETLARAHCTNGALDQAIEIQRRAVDIAAARDGFSEIILLGMGNNLLKYLLQSDDDESSMRLIEEMINVENRFPGKALFIKAENRSLLALHLADHGRYELAEPLARASLSYMQNLPLGIKGLGPDEVKSVLGFCLAGMNRLEEAESFLKEGFEGMKNNPFVPLEVQQQALERLILFYERTGNPAEAARWRNRQTGIGLPASGTSEER